MDNKFELLNLEWNESKSNFLVMVAMAFPLVLAIFSAKDKLVIYFLLFILVIYVVMLFFISQLYFKKYNLLHNYLSKKK